MKTIIKIFICLSLIYTPMFANAANIGGWTLGNPIAQGASAIVNGTKTAVINGANVIKNSTAKITPSASAVAKVLSRGAAGYALSVAVEQLLGAVDWVLDPANNRIKYYEEGEGLIYRALSCQGEKSVFLNCLESHYNNVLSNHPSYSGPAQCTLITNFKFECTAIQKSTNKRIAFASGQVTNIPSEKEEKYLPLPVVAQQVINNAAGGDASAQQATVAAAQDIINEAETDNTKARPIVNQLEANAETSTQEEAQGQAKPQADPVTGEQAPPIDISLEFPKFCGWAPLVCEAAQVVISFPQTLTGWWDTANQKANDWASSISNAYHDFMRDDELPDDETTLDISEIETPDLQENAISWNSSCPADVSIPISMQGVSSTLVFSWSPWCQLLSIIKPAIIASAYIGAAFIVLGLRT